MVIEKETMKQLSKKLSLPYVGTEQDWDIEMADATRINFFLHYFCNNKLSEEERFALMSLIIVSYDDYLNEYEINADEIWNTIKTILEKERSLYSEIINYWALRDNLNKNDLFSVTALMRSIDNVNNVSD